MNENAEFQFNSIKLFCTKNNYEKIVSQPISLNIFYYIIAILFTIIDIRYAIELIFKWYWVYKIHLIYTISWTPKL